MTIKHAPEENLRAPEKRIVLGIDPSTYTGLSALTPTEVICTKQINFPGAAGMGRVQKIANAVAQTVFDVAPDAVFLEGFAFGNRFSLVLMVEISTLIKDRLFAFPLYRPYLVPPTTLKKFTTGKGGCKKDAMAAAVKARWGFTSTSDDVVDSFALAKLGHEYLWGDPTGIKGVER